MYALRSRSKTPVTWACGYFGRVRPKGLSQAQSEYNHVLANILRSRYVARTPPLEARSPGRRSNVMNASVTRYVAIATQPVHRLQIRPIMHNKGAASTTPPSYIRVRAVVWAYGRGKTDTDARDHNTFCVVYDSRKM